MAIAKSTISVPEILDTIKMKWDAFAQLPENPQQRDTAAHARKAIHLLNWHPRQAYVAAAVLPNGRTVKLDGHTRCYMWMNDKAPVPPVPLTVERWRVADLEMAGALKQTYDNRRATNQSHDVLYGAVRHHGFEFQSEVLREQKFGGAINLIENYLFDKRSDETIDNLVTVLDNWRQELLLFDTCMPTRVRFNIGLQAAAFLLLRRHGTKALTFLKGHQSKAGEKYGGKFNAQEAFSRRYEILKKDAARRGSNTRNEDYVKTAIAGYNAVEQGRMFTEGQGGLRSLSVAEFEKWLDETRSIRG